MPSRRAAAITAAASVVGEHGEDGQHRVGAVKPGLGDLARVDDEVLGEDRPAELAPDRPQILERPAEIGRVGEHADRVRRAAIGARERARVGARPDRPADGEPRFTSMMKRAPGRASAALRLRRVGSGARRRSRASRAATSIRLRATISARIRLQPWVASTNSLSRR